MRQSRGDSAWRLPILSCLLVHSTQARRDDTPDDAAGLSRMEDREYNSDPCEVDVDSQTPRNETSSNPTDPSASPSPTESTPTVSSDNVFRVPTVSFSNTLTPQSAKQLCDLSAFGAFGSISQDRRQFDFYYQVETTSSVTQPIFSNDLLVLLDKELGIKLLPSLLNECREEGRMLQGEEDACEVRGFSRLPLDRVMVGGKNVNAMITL